MSVRRKAFTERSPQSVHSPRLYSLYEPQRGFKARLDDKARNPARHVWLTEEPGWWTSDHCWDARNHRKALPWGPWTNCTAWACSFGEGILEGLWWMEEESEEETESGDESDDELLGNILKIVWWYYWREQLLLEQLIGCRDHFISGCFIDPKCPTWQRYGIHIGWMESESLGPRHGTVRQCSAR